MTTTIIKMMMMIMGMMTTKILAMFYILTMIKQCFKIIQNQARNYYDKGGNMYMILYLHVIFVYGTEKVSY